MLGAGSHVSSVGADGERDNTTVMCDVLRAMGEPEDAFDWVRDRPGRDRRYAIDSSKLRRELGWAPRQADSAEGRAQTLAWSRANEAWWRPAKEATEAKYARQGSRGARGKGSPPCCASE